MRIARSAGNLPGFGRGEDKFMQVLILAGGLGKRLRSVVDDRPKPMALVETSLSWNTSLSS